MITTKKVGRQTEYSESVRHSCGHTVEYTTLGYKMERRQVQQKRQSPCPKCQLGALLYEKVPKTDGWELYEGDR